MFMEMNKLFKTIKSRFTMKYQRNLFTDSVSGKTVSLYTDCFGIEYMSDAGFFRPISFRVKRGDK